MYLFDVVFVLYVFNFELSKFDENEGDHNKLKMEFF